MIEMKNINPSNINKILSNLSNIPPCPGIIFEKSFLPKYLLIAEKTKSPNCPNIDKNKEIIIKMYIGNCASTKL